MRNNELIRDFVQGETEGKASNIYINGTRLINYTTCIAYRFLDNIIINGQKYSSTTSVHQNRIKDEVGDGRYFEIPTEKLFNKLVDIFTNKEELEVDSMEILNQLRIMQNTLMDTNNFSSKKARKESYDFEVNILDEMLEETLAERSIS